MPASRRAKVSSSPLSSADSFKTATASPTNPVHTNTADVIGPDDEDGQWSGYRKARQLPPELREHCKIYLEEALQLISLRLIDRLHAAGGATSLPSKPGLLLDTQHDDGGLYCPPPNQLAFLNTLLIHPDFTTRPREDSWVDIASSSLNCLRNMLRTVGPVNAKFNEAFRFGHTTRRSGSATPDGGDTIYDPMGEAQLLGRYSKHSIWRCGQDFFSVVGWAFNCSVLYPNRWEYWRQWLEFMLDVIEDDLHERLRLDEEEHVSTGGREGECVYALLQDSILAGYIKQRNSRAGRLKHIMKAIFADGNSSSNSLFHEVWHMEHKGKSKKTSLKKRKREVNLEKGDYGGLLDDDSVYSSQNSEPPTPQKRNTYSNKQEFQALEPAYVESVPLRQRLFALLSYLCNYLPDPPIDLPDLYESYETTVRTLPLSIFTAFVDSTTSCLLRESQISVLQSVLSNFMPSNAVDPGKVDAEVYDANGTSPAILERCFLPFAANTIAAEDNAKVSVLLEELVKLVWVIGTVPFSDRLYNAATKGVAAREDKVKKKLTGGRGRRGAQPKVDDSDAEAKAALEESSKRLLLLVELITDGVGDEDDTVGEDEAADQVDRMDEGTLSSIEPLFP
ncbi:hypothetical protein JX265_000302 [Neoarthrinium moseri]|uniref:Uncharacterized protein n=1 Tax=Neoarthrinium moseri TaxID=1658444 RepID=A0A9Q0AVF6_9PEZI|nr:hypothetical protein JX265_000302 [Neoarthrinium moseri]